MFNNLFGIRTLHGNDLFLFWFRRQLSYNLHMTRKYYENNQFKVPYTKYRVTDLCL